MQLAFYIEPSKLESLSQLSFTHRQSNGIPQGSPLSGTLLMVAINDLLVNIIFPVKPILSANDLSIHIRTNNPARA